MVKVGIIGIGHIAEDYISMFSKGLIKDAELSALTSRNRENLERILLQYDLKETKLYSSLEEMLEADEIDAVIITAPHVYHPEMAQKLLESGKHVMIEKPVGIRIKEVEALNKAADAYPHLKAGVMFNYRSSELYGFVKDLVDSGDMGELRRAIWQVTNLYRTYDYYNQTIWRGSYKAEGGGVLINQAIHQLDTLLWMTGMPEKVVAFTKEGFHRPITAENDVMIHMFFSNGASGQFLTGTHESPGTNRFELSFSKGQIVIENDSKVKITKLAEDEEDFAKETKENFPEVPYRVEEKTFEKQPNRILQARLINNFVQSVLGKEEIICPLSEGIKSVRMINGTYMSAWTEKTVSLDFDPEDYELALNEKIRQEEDV
ncbi:Gfo/Idh/MocA family oxidoreductase [Proteiniclasticum sp.]|uniref:Gfo/Idh/MocA family protein n=1 Tax=Proteiniclasticum sp. TaxID=2053595 RepID=UPI002899E776|nr:Gfo/Idh/MocA family oxidoreductase [Proteiniclasticum sp.]